MADMASGDGRYTTILAAREGGVLTLTLNRPEVLNAFNRTMTSELLDALRQAERDPEVRCVVITGAGRAFSAGEDLKSRQEGGERSFIASLRERYNPLILRLRTMEKPVIAAVNGVAAGAGLGLALACDLRIASEQARFGQVFVKVGLAPDSGTSLFLLQLVGLGKALEMAFFGDLVPADEALRLGLVNRVVPHEELAAATREWAQRLAAGATRAMGLAKRAFNFAAGAALAQVLEYEAYLQEIAGHTEDHREGVRAFLEKREPRFQGR
ncbi:enoyl-CoA hydratase/isomerase family protein [Thermaerobacter composti]|uniref:Enoyl-CoA hydratase-related protein n=2 Tax=Thermaerobacter TaxID=73918 RepID=A0ABZ0QN20_9FIRM|nr:enoyl-CoA hydratase-related protein [Thermaerobacter composti]WPD18883.1 enoyl-CoA hydratase-related protein [Thermaerobacter composti]